MSEYSNEELAAIYELGRLYFEMGYFAPAERVFNGLAAVDEGRTPARLGLGVVKLERGLFQEATTHFRMALQSGMCPIESKLGLCAAFIATQDIARARSILAEVSREIDAGVEVSAEQQKLFEAFVLRCRSA